MALSSIGLCGHGLFTSASDIFHTRRLALKGQYVDIVSDRYGDCTELGDRCVRSANMHKNSTAYEAMNSGLESEAIRDIRRVGSRSGTR